MLELCSVASGSSGNCICVGTDRTHVLIDAGLSGKRIEEGLNHFDYTTPDMEAIFVTHEHSDHMAGIGVLSRKYHLPIYATTGTIEAMKKMKSLGKIDEELYHVIKPGDKVEIGDMTMEAMHISHDAADPVSYKVIKGDKKLAVVTDLGKYDDELVAKLQNLDGLLLEANHDVNMLLAGIYPYPLKQRILGDRGHLSNERSGQLLGRLLHDNFKEVLLGHLSHENNMEELAYEAVRVEVTMGENPYKAEDFPIKVAKRDVASHRIRV